MKSFWLKLKKPIMVLAPMEDVTDTVFRRIVASTSRPDVFFTEFTSVDGLFSHGREAVIHRLEFTEEERPIVAQIWGNSPELFYKSAGLIADLKFDGIDINMGCPEKNVTKYHAGAACINDPERAAEIITATREGSRGLPVSIKTRLGYKKIATDWIPFLLEQNPDALEIHGRTAAELSNVPAHWDEIARVVQIRNQMKKQTIMIGNGDVVDFADAVDKCTKYGTDGVMIGRGIFHNLWAFNRQGVSHMDDYTIMFKLMRKHINLFKDVWGERKNFAILKKFFKIYVHGFANAGMIRETLMRGGSSAEVLRILSGFTSGKQGNTLP